MKKHVTLSLFAFVMISCVESSSLDENNNCQLVRTEYANMVDAPATASTNTSVTVSVDFSVMNGCGNFSKFKESVNGNTRTLEVEAKYFGCICTASIGPLNAQYTFTPTSPGDYIIHVRSGSSTFITKTISVN